ncbi:(S)-ureidoglycine aminohydrolase [Pseudooceanicola sp. CBS1P-1]|uniref:(S)-ureidoglycine aminohydrolase n=1 Tax=Pseudooceanicola albus TaxID=2692189 RepID=A0A6L7FYU7_9RHOB|nr:MULTISPECIES: bifunctional allantoicase/(S)-ureidoglycine aminohydrolase [Pseudooceanicola]MBT9383976.1 (S)-ureidoglycine aminohydrolase [Pseudooceanicola endophyticus]MXN16612.1 (S)-ureidoglycine aminohydrolase [Pseudooceanicola albus]
MTETRSYYTPRGGLPAQHERHYDPARFTTAYAVIPAATMSDIVTSFLPGWEKTRAWIIARPLSGFAETFAQLIVEVAPGGGAATPEPDAGAEGVLFVVDGTLTLTLEGTEHALTPGGYAFLPPGARWSVTNATEATTTFHWVRKRYEPAPGIPAPEAFVSHDDAVTPNAMPDTNGSWATTRFVDPSDLRHDMHVNIVTFGKGGRIPFAETHIMEHGLYVLEGRARYLLNTDWVEVGPGDFMWLRAFCPQACEQIGDEPFRYLLYKDVNRHPSLVLA